jgi:hypothetical protein
MGRPLHSGLCAVLSAWFAIGSIGCDGDKPNSSASTGPVQRNDLASRLAAALCEGIVDCCRAGGFFTDTASCKASMESQLKALLAVRLANQNVSYNPEAAGRCVAAYRNAAVACTNRDLFSDIGTTCAGVFAGTVALGSPCTTDDECVQSSTQYVTCDAGICTNSGVDMSMGEGPHAKLGDTCGSTCERYGDGATGCGATGTASPTSSASCWVNDGLVCGAGLVCVDVPTLGESCAPSYHCAEGAYCNAGICAAQIDTGSCASNSIACSGASYCDTASQMCTPKKADGVVCDSDGQCIGGDCLGDRCRVWSIADPAICAGLLAPG